MASALTDKLSRLVKEMRGQARITESNVQDMLREVRMALQIGRASCRERV